MKKKKLLFISLTFITFHTSLLYYARYLRKNRSQSSIFDNRM